MNEHSQVGRFASASVPRRAAFTLIELLVVISIIGLLIALLMPALGKAREASNKTVCMNQMRQIYLSVSTYGVDFNYIPSARYVDSPTTWSGVDTNYANASSWMNGGSGRTTWMAFYFIGPHRGKYHTGGVASVRCPSYKDYPAAWAAAAAPLGPGKLSIWNDDTWGVTAPHYGVFVGRDHPFSWKNSPRTARANGLIRLIDWEKHAGSAYLTETVRGGSAEALLIDGEKHGYPTFLRLRPSRHSGNLNVLWAGGHVNEGPNPTGYAGANTKYLEMWWGASHADLGWYYPKWLYVHGQP